MLFLSQHWLSTCYPTTLPPPLSMLSQTHWQHLHDHWPICPNAKCTHTMQQDYHCNHAQGTTCTTGAKTANLVQLTQTNQEWSCCLWNFNCNCIDANQPDGTHGQKWTFFTYASLQKVEQKTKYVTKMTVRCVKNTCVQNDKQSSWHYNRTNHTSAVVCNGIGCFTCVWKYYRCTSRAL